mmetsp:Transcript_37186/g.51337  ORF Transcript_37186/g.51337 Transcript_37186/m.51337 type:complete len:861 (-) Transcript_37186:1826-4408(-)
MKIPTQSSTTSALHLATKAGAVDCVQFLLDAQFKENVDLQDESGQTALHIAVKESQKEIMKLLCSHGADVNACDNDGVTALHFAAWSGNADAIDFLMQQGVNVEVEDESEQTPMYYACIRGKKKAAELLCLNQANLSHCDARGMSPLHHAAKNGHGQCVGLLLARGSGAAVEDDLGRTPLHYATQALECVELLVEAGVIIADKDKSGRTALFYACQQGHDDAVRFLILRGADPDDPDANSQKPTDVAKGYILRVIKDAQEEADRKRDVKLTKQYQKVVVKFNKKPKDGIKMLLKEKQFRENTPEDVARFLQNFPGLEKAKIGELLGEGDEMCLEILTCFVDYMDFSDAQFDTALRLFLSKFRLPGEAQKIDRIMEHFAKRYCTQSPTTFPHEDVAYMLSFSLIMLNTDLHNPNIKNKMTEGQFVKNNTNVGDFPDMPAEFLIELYNKIKDNEIKMSDGKGSLAGALKHSGLLMRNKRKAWKPKYFVLRETVLFCFKSEDDAATLSVEDLGVESTLKKKKIRKFGLDASVSARLLESKSAPKGKIVCELLVSSGEDPILIAGEEEEIMGWIQSIGRVTDNPFEQLLKHKKGNEVKGGGEGGGASAAKGSNKGGGEIYSSQDMEKLHANAMHLLLCTQEKGELVKVYGSQNAKSRPPVKYIHYFYILVPQLKQQFIVMDGQPWSSFDQMCQMVKEAGDDYFSHFEIDDIASKIADQLEVFLKKDYSVVIIGHSFGGSVGICLAQKLPKKKTSEVITYGEPCLLPPNLAPKKIPVLRVICTKDPVPKLFPPRSNFGQRLTLLRDEFYCYEKDPPLMEGGKIDVQTLEVSDLAYNHLNHYGRLLKTKAEKGASLPRSAIHDYVG